jgi:hypothetical protein
MSVYVIKILDGVYVVVEGKTEKITLNHSKK